MQSVQAASLEEKLAKGIQATEPKAQKEEQLHFQVNKFLQLALPVNGDCMWWHSANGQARHPVVAMKLKAMGVRAGIPDYVFVWPHLTREIGGWYQEGMKIGFIELKRSGKEKLSPAQMLIQGWSERIGIYHATCASIDGVETTLRKWGCPIRASMRRVGA